MVADPFVEIPQDQRTEAAMSGAEQILAGDVLIV
jgi:hypothetical protein